MSLYQIAKRLPVVRGLTYQVPPYFVGSVIENRLGLQVFRMLSKHLAWSLRSVSVAREFAGHLEILERDGVTQINDFLTPEVFAQVKTEMMNAAENMTFNPTRGESSGRLHVASLRISTQLHNFPATGQFLAENSLIKNLACVAARRPLKVEPTVTFEIYRLADASQPDNDVENILHSDLHCPTIKAFYYLNDVDETNGAFVYAKGSHRLTLNRLRHEYDISIRTAKLRRGDQDIPDHLIANRGPHRRNIISPENRQRMRVAETQFCIPANTLVITNNMGFHRRGEFTGSRDRQAIIINFRNLEERKTS
jgi:hypothetical protein